MARTATNNQSRRGARNGKQSREQPGDAGALEMAHEDRGRPEPQGRSQAGGRTEQQGARNGLAAQNRRDTRNAEAAQSSKALEMARPPFSLYIYNIYKQKLSTE